MLLNLKHLVCALFVFFVPTSAFAYIDPGTGSILIQGIIAAIAAIGVTLKLYWHRFKALFRLSPKDQTETEEPVSPKSQPKIED